MLNVSAAVIQKPKIRLEPGIAKATPWQLVDTKQQKTKTDLRQGIYVTHSHCLHTTGRVVSFTAIRCYQAVFVQPIATATSATAHSLLPEVVREKKS